MNSFALLADQRTVPQWSWWRRLFTAGAVVVAVMAVNAEAWAQTVFRPFLTATGFTMSAAAHNGPCVGSTSRALLMPCRRDWYREKQDGEPDDKAKYAEQNQDPHHHYPTRKIRPTPADRPRRSSRPSSDPVDYVRPVFVVRSWFLARIGRPACILASDIPAFLGFG